MWITLINSNNVICLRQTKQQNEDKAVCIIGLIHQEKDLFAAWKTKL